MNRSLTILIIEDTESDVILLRRALNKAGVTAPVQVVNDGGEAIRYLQGTGQYGDRAAFPYPGVIFTDLKMPGMGGFELLQWLRTHPECPFVPVIVLSGMAPDEDINRAYQMGANACLPKPMDAGTYHEMMRKAFEFWSCCHWPVVAESLRT